MLRHLKTRLELMRRCMFKCMYIQKMHMYARMYVVKYGCMYVWLCCMYACMYVCMYLCMYVCMRNLETKPSLQQNTSQHFMDQDARYPSLQHFSSMETSPQEDAVQGCLGLEFRAAWCSMFASRQNSFLSRTNLFAVQLELATHLCFEDLGLGLGHRG